MAAMGKAGGGRNEVDPRFISLFAVFNMSLPSHNVLFHIFSTILKAHVHDFLEAVQSIVNPLTRATLKFYSVSSEPQFLLIWCKKELNYFRFCFENFHPLRASSTMSSTCVIFPESTVVSVKWHMSGSKDRKLSYEFGGTSSQESFVIVSLTREMVRNTTFGVVIKVHLTNS